MPQIEQAAYPRIVAAAMRPLTMFPTSLAMSQKAWDWEDFELVKSLTIGKLSPGAGAF
jgi:hypothetical protein